MTYCTTLIVKNMILAYVAKRLMEYNIEPKVGYNTEPHMFGNLVCDRRRRGKYRLRDK